MSWLEWLGSSSEIPLWLRLVQAGSLFLIGIAGAAIAYRQYRVAKDKLRLDLFDRRLKVFEQAYEFAGKVMMNDYPEFGDFRVMFNAQTGARFLFGSEVEDYLVRMEKVAHELRRLSRRIEGRDYENRSSDIESLDKSIVEFADLSQNAHKVFLPYMRFPK